MQVKKAGTPEWVDATLAIILRENDLVRTGVNATAEILLPDGTRFGVQPDSLISIPGLDPEGYPFLAPRPELRKPPGSDPGDTGVRTFKGQGQTTDSGNGKPKNKGDSAK